jgi:hypothetical protein
VGRLQALQQLERRQAAIEREPIVAVLRQAGVRALGDVAHGAERVVVNEPCAQEIIDHDVDVLFSGPRRGRHERLFSRRGVRIGTVVHSHAEQASPPVLKPRPAIRVPIEIISGAHV